VSKAGASRTNGTVPRTAPAAAIGKVTGGSSKKKTTTKMTMNTARRCPDPETTLMRI
jgi:hypothetical protein